MTFEEAVKLYLQAPTKRFGNEKSPAAHSTLLWMASRYPKGLRNPDTKKLTQYSKYMHDKNPRWKVVWDETSGMFAGRDMHSIISLDVTRMENVLRTQKGLSPAGINNYLRYLKALCRYSKSKLSVKFEDFPEFELGAEESRVEWLEPEDARKLIQWLDPLRADMVRFALATGLRNANVTLLKWAWWHPESGDIIIPKTEIKNGCSLHLIVTKGAKAVLDSRLRFREQLLKRHPHLSGKLDYVFVQDGQKSLGKPFYRTSVCNKTWKRAVRLAGLPPWVRFHSLRHTFATWHVSAGTTTKELMSVGGWKSPNSVNRYMHQNEMHKKKVASRLDGVLL